MSTISTHILDTSRGKPANGVAVYLETQNHDETWAQLTHAWTDDEGRVKPFFLLEEPLPAGTYRLVFDTETYFSDSSRVFYSRSLHLPIGEDPQHYHSQLKFVRLASQRIVELS